MCSLWSACRRLMPLPSRLRLLHSKAQRKSAATVVTERVARCVTRECGRVGGHSSETHPPLCCGVHTPRTLCALAVLVRPPPLRSVALSKILKS